ncbi:hypothetical protein BD779DRAFT_1505713 [Infundibulicybe gibba]|nr:hypothetical protein BD779DRAFT_1505713 [Infundibulicybe gibba]
MKTAILAAAAATFNILCNVNAQVSQPWGQCGGKTWTGPTICPADQVCTYMNEYFSLCRPISTIDPLPTPSPPAITTPPREW